MMAPARASSARPRAVATFASRRRGHTLSFDPAPGSRRRRDRGRRTPCRAAFGHRGATPSRGAPMKFLLILATLGLATFVVLRRRNPELADRVQSAVTDAA